MRARPDKPRAPGVSRGPAATSRTIDSALDASAHLHLDALRLRLGLLRQVDEEHAVLRLGADLLRVDARRQREAAGERAVGQLDAMVVLALLLHLQLALALQGEHAVLESDLDVLRLDAGQLGADDDLLAVLVDVARGRPPDRLTGAEQALVAQRSIHLLLHSGKLAEGVPRGQHRHDFSFSLGPW